MLFVVSPVVPCALLVIALIFVVKSALSSPLRQIPAAHWSVPIPYIGSLWILYRRFQSRNNATTYEAHVRHGPVVRLGYNEISVSCVDNGIRTIYSGGWEKHDWYPRQFAGFSVINMFSTIHHTPHSQKKRTMANIYSKSYLQTTPQLKYNSRHLLTTRFLPLLQSASHQKQGLNMHEVNNCFTMDFMSTYLFGLAQSTNFTQDVAYRQKWLHLYHSRRDFEFFSAEVPPRLMRVLDALHLSPVPKAVAYANQFLEDWAGSMCRAADSYLSRTQVTPGEGEEPYVGDDPLVFKQFKVGMDKLRLKDPTAGREILPHIITDTTSLDEESMKKFELYSEMFDHLGAGHETSAIALTYLQWELSKDRALQDQLHQELLTLEPQITWPVSSLKSDTTFAVPEPKIIDSLPLLHAIVMETLRLHAPIPGMEPRVSPHVKGGNTLGTYSGIPGGVRVSSMPYTLHRNPEVFPQPEKFIPERWLTTQTQTQTQTLPFSTSPGIDVDPTSVSSIPPASNADEKSTNATSMAGASSRTTLTSTEAHLREMHRWFWAFGSGGRMCIGSNLAMQEIKLIVAAMYTNWTTEIVDDEGIEATDAYTVRPRSNKFMVKFTHRD